MSTKQQNLDDPRSCLNKAEANEPIFILRAKDPLAPMVVRIWVSLNSTLEAHAAHKAGDAYRVALAMEDWARDKYGEPKIDWAR